MESSLEFPQLRSSLNVRVETISNEQVVVLDCPLGVSEPIALKAACAPVLQMFDGRHSVEDIANKLSAYKIPPQLIRDLVSLLDQNLFLSGKRFLESKARIEMDFREAKVRKPYLAGRGYSDKAEDLRSFVDQLVAKAPQASMDESKMFGLIAPHIDYRRGSRCYGLTYAHFQTSRPDVSFVLGTSHQPGKSLFQLSTKDFETPLGTLSNATDITTKILNSYGPERGLQDELLHRREHSLELQMPFIARFASNTRIVPILIGSFYPFVAKAIEPESSSEFQDFVGGFAEIIEETKRAGLSISIVSGVDMAHVGDYFGDGVTLSPEFMSSIRSRDLEYLEHIKNRDRRALFSHIAEDGDARKICGFPTLYSVLAALEKTALSYRIADYGYDQAVNYEANCAVTFAAAGMYLN